MFSYETIFNSPVVLDNIFLYMDLLDLYRARSVCKLWKSVADAEISKRRESVELDYVAVSFPVEIPGSPSEMEETTARNVRVLKKKFDGWKKSWESSPTVLLASDRLSFGHGVKNSWVPHDCTCVLINGNPVSVDGVNVDSEICEAREMECCSYLAFRGRNVAVLASKSEDDTKDFFADLHRVLVDPDLKLIHIFSRHDKMNLLQQMADKEVDAASRRGVVVLCCAEKYSGPKILNFRGHERLDCAFAAIYFKGENVKAASIRPVSGNIEDLEKSWEMLNDVQEGFFPDCDETEILAFMLGPPNGRDDDFDADNEEQEAFRSIIPDVPLIGWLDAAFMSGSNTNVDALPNSTGVLRPKHAVNYIHAVLVMK